MTIAFICPDSFKDYGFVQKVFSKYKMERIVCATSNATRLAQAYASEYHSVKYGHEKRGGKRERLRRIIRDADKVVIIEFSDYDPEKTGFSRTQVGLTYAKQQSVPLSFITYDREGEAQYQDKDELLEMIESFCLPESYDYYKRYSHPLSLASKALRDDKDVVKAAIIHYGFAFDFASRQMQGKRQTVLELIGLNRSIFPYIDEKLRKEKEVIASAEEGASPENVYCKKKNATYLFNQPTGKFHHSESRWSAIAQLASIWMGREKKELTTYTSTYSSENTEKWLQKKGQLSFDRWNSHNTIVEGRLNNKLFSVDGWSKDYDNISPDIIHIDNTNSKVIMIEIKTIGSSVKSNLKLYQRVVDTLRDSNKWSCELYYLLSYGHEKNSDWKLLGEADAQILLWEELFVNIKDLDIAPYIDAHLEQYTLMPEWI
jgi:hypothetical protein